MTVIPPSLGSNPGCGRACELYNPLGTLDLGRFAGIPGRGGGAGGGEGAGGGKSLARTSHTRRPRISGTPSPAEPAAVSSRERPPQSVPGASGGPRPRRAAEDIL